MMDIKEKVKVRTNHFSDYHLHPEVSFQNIHSTLSPMINSEEILYKDKNNYTQPKCKMPGCRTTDISNATQKI